VSARRFAGPAVALTAAVVIVGCGGSGSPVAPAESGELSPSAAETGVAECPSVELRGPTGALVNLNGIWVQDADGNAQAMKWWLWSFGECVWATGMTEEYSEEGGPGATADQVQAFRGTMRSDFSIEGAMVLLGPHPPVENPIREAEVRMLIRFDDDGGITLLEDREPGVAGPRCMHENYCPAPLLLRPQ
jgi:hypothetical protein